MQRKAILVVIKNHQNRKHLGLATGLHQKKKEENEQEKGEREKEQEKGEKGEEERRENKSRTNLNK